MIDNQSPVTIEGGTITPKFSNTGMSIKSLVALKIAKDEEAIKKQEQKISSIDVKIHKTDIFIGQVQKIQNLLLCLTTPNIDDSFRKCADIFMSKDISILSSNEETHPAYQSLEVYATELPPGKYYFKIHQIATPQQQNFLNIPSADDDVVNGATGMFTPGVFEINNHAFTLYGGENLQDINQLITSESTNTNVTSTINMLATNSYMLSLKTLYTGFGQDLVINDLDGVFANLASNIFNAQDASFSLNNEAYTRSTNNIDDILLSGKLSIKLLNATNMETISVTSDIDIQLIKSKIKDFVANVNLLLDMIYKEQAESQKIENIGNYTLWSEQPVRNILNELPPILSGNDNIAANTVSKSLRSIGITSERKLNSVQYESSFVLDENKLLQMLINNFDEVKNTLYSHIETNSSDVKFLYGTKPLKTMSFILDIDHNRPFFQIDNSSIQDRVRVVVNNQTYRPNHFPHTNTIVGLPNSPIDGLGLRVSDQTSNIIQVNISQGIADKVSLFLKKFVSTSTNNLVPKQINNHNIYNQDGNLEMTTDRRQTFSLTSLNEKYKAEKDKKYDDLFRLKEKLIEKKKKETARITHHSNSHQRGVAAVETLELMRKNNNN